MTFQEQWTALEVEELYEAIVHMAQEYRRVNGMTVDHRLLMRVPVGFEHPMIASGLVEDLSSKHNIVFDPLKVVRV